MRNKLYKITQSATLWIALATLSPLAAVWEQSTKAAFGKVMEYVNTSWDNGDRYKGQKENDGTRTGLGVYKWSDNTYYIGNFLNNSRDGYGMYLAGDSRNCQIYVGNISSGYFSGKGTCYDENGNLTYDGNFSNNKTTDTYPSTGDYSNYKFKTISYKSGNTYIGETNNGKRSGYGIFVWASGDAWFGNWERDGRKGKGIHLSYNAKKWQTEDCDGDECTKIASSSDNSGSYSNNNNGNNNSSSYNSNSNTSLICSVCGGSRQIPCTFCGGMGKQLSMGITGYDYNGNPRYGQTYVNCNKCFGTRKMTCWMCNGLGSVNPSNVPLTPNNNYDGNSYNNGNYGNSGYNSGGSSRSKQKCTNCGGSGFCTACGGTKIMINRDAGRYTGKDVTAISRCPVCGGDGKCGVCRGSGEKLY